jgi:hypothetical protein
MSETKREPYPTRRPIRVRSGAFVASPPEATKASPYVPAEMLDEKGNGVGQHYVRQLPAGSPLWVHDTYIHPDDLKAGRR